MAIEDLAFGDNDPEVLAVLLRDQVDRPIEHQAGRVVGADEVRRFVLGDFSSMEAVFQTPHEYLVEECGGRPIVVSAALVACVLQDLLDGRISAIQAQAWASFIRCGYVPMRGRTPVRPLRIDYEIQCEDEIVEAIGRMDEIGDIIDGELLLDEIVELIAGLRRCAGSAPSIV